MRAKRENEIGSDDESLKDDKFYQINAIVTLSDDGYEYSTNAVVKTQDLDKALVIINRWIKERDEEKRDFATRLEEAKLISVDYIIDEQFSAAYNLE